MRAIKRTAFIPLLFIALLSCKKYDEGPGFSLRTKKARLCNEWSVKQYFENHEDKTSSYRNLIPEEVMELKKNGTYSYNEVSNWPWGSPSDAGKWEWKDDKESFVTTSETQSKTTEYHVLKLKESELWVETTDSTGKLLEFHYVPKQML